MELIRAMPANGFIGRIEWWKIGNQCKATISFGKSIQTIRVVSADGDDITPIVAKKMGIKLVGEESDPSGIRLNRTIDAYFIECSETQLEGLLKQIDSIC